MADRRVTISCVERGWQAARTWSLAAVTGNRPVVHVIKGQLPADVRALIAPRAGIRIIGVPRPLFWPCVAACAAWAGVRGRLDGILVDHDKSARRLRRLAAAAGIRLLRIRQSEDGHVELEPCASR